MPNEIIFMTFFALAPLGFIRSTVVIRTSVPPLRKQACSLSLDTVDCTTGQTVELAWAGKPMGPRATKPWLTNVYRGFCAVSQAK